MRMILEINKNDYPGWINCEQDIVQVEFAWDRLYIRETGILRKEEGGYRDNVTNLLIDISFEGEPEKVYYKILKNK